MERSMQMNLCISLSKFFFFSNLKRKKRGKAIKSYYMSRAEHRNGETRNILKVLVWDEFNSTFFFLSHIYIHIKRGTSYSGPGFSIPEYFISGLSL